MILTIEERKSGRLKLRKSNKWALALIFLGFTGAAMFYSSYIGLFLPIGLPCVACPHVFAPGVEPWKKFVRFTVIGGVLNATFWLAVGGTIWGLVKFVKIIMARNGEKIGVDTGKSGVTVEGGF